MATLYLVSTPIGNLGDLSPRGAEVLCSVPRILAEDTRRTGVLAKHVGSDAQLVSVHAHNEAERVTRILRWLDTGQDLALVSDAGTPLVSDPGARIVEAAAGAGHTVVPIPGASAVLTALVGSGLPTDRFTFLGFPDRKGSGRATLLERAASAGETTVFFESPRRLVALLDDLGSACGPERRVSVGRELTKVHEEFVRGTLSEVADYYRERPPKGEATVVVAPADPDTGLAARVAAARGLAQELLSDGMKPSEAARVLADRLDLARNEAYRIVHGLREGTTER